MAPYNVPISLQATMSQFPSTSFQAQSTTIALKSFGYCFASDNSPVPSHYTVLQGQHLSACFDITFPESYTGAFSRSHRLRITDGSTLLEDLNLNVLGEAVREAAEESRTSGTKPRTYVCEQCPVIAMRYPVSHDKLRKFQFRTVERKDFYEALKIFSLAGVIVEPASQSPRKRQVHVVSQPSASQAVLGTSTQGSISNKQHDIDLNRPRLQPESAKKTVDASESTHIQPVPALPRAPHVYARARPSSSDSRYKAPYALSTIARDSQARESAQLEHLPVVATNVPVSRPRPFDFDLSSQRELASPTDVRTAAFTTDGRSTLLGQEPVKERSRKPSKPQVGLTSHLSGVNGNGMSRHQNPTSSIFTSVETSRPRIAQDIDTQLLLARAAAKKLGSSNKGQKSQHVASNPKAVQPINGLSSSQIRNRNYRCDNCRTSKRKCEKIADDPEGRCQPCLALSVECTFELLSELKSFSQTSASARSTIPVHNPPKDHHIEVLSDRALRSQSRALSLSSQLPAVDKISKTVRGDLKTKPLRGVKRNALPVVAGQPKRAKTSDIPVSGPELHERPQISTAQQAPPKTERAIHILRRPTEELEQTALRTLHSDATTMTVDSGDLDPPLRRHFQKANTKVVKSKLTSNCPTYSEISEHADAVRENVIAVPDPPSRPAVRANYQRATTIDEPLSEAANEGERQAQPSMTLTAFSRLRDDARNEQLDKFIRDAILSDEFLALCKMLDGHWEKHLVTSRI